MPPSVAGKTYQLFTHGTADFFYNNNSDSVLPTGAEKDINLGQLSVSKDNQLTICGHPATEVVWADASLSVHWNGSWGMFHAGRVWFTDNGKSLTGSFDSAGGGSIYVVGFNIEEADSWAPSPQSLVLDVAPPVYSQITPELAYSIKTVQEIAETKPIEPLSTVSGEGIFNPPLYSMHPSMAPGDNVQLGLMPTYDMGSSLVADDSVQFDLMPMDTVAKTPQTNINMDLYTTKRKLKGSSGKLQRYENVYISVEFSYGTMSPVVMISNDDDKTDDISQLVTCTVTPTLHLVKPRMSPLGNVANKHLYDYFFDVELTGTGGERAFSGTFSEIVAGQAAPVEYEWSGKFSTTTLQPRAIPEPTPVDPKGNSMGTLLMISSQRYDGPKSANDLHLGGPGEKQGGGGLDIAQVEGDKIYRQLLLASIPEKHRKKLLPDLQPLDAEVQKIAQNNQSYLKRAGVCFLLDNISISPNVTHDHKRNIDTNKLEAFRNVCTSYSSPVSGKDPVTEYGWDRKKNEELLSRVQTQFLNVTHSCYDLGYLRVMGSFQPFLEFPNFWYNELARKLSSDDTLRELQLQCAGNKQETASHLLELHTQLRLLRNHVGPDGKAVVLQDGIKEPLCIIQGLMGSILQASQNAIQWNDVTRQHLKDVAAGLDGPASQAVDVEDHTRNAMLEFRNGRTGQTAADLITSLIGVIDVVHVMYPNLSAMELSSKTLLELDALITKNKVHDSAIASFLNPESEMFGSIFKEVPPEYPAQLTMCQKIKKGVAAYLRAACVAACTMGLVTLLMGNAQFSTVEKINMWGSVVLTGIELFGKTLSKYAGQVARAIGRTIAKWLPTKGVAMLTNVGAKILQAVGYIGTALLKLAVMALSVFATISAYDDLTNAMEAGRWYDITLATLQLIATAGACLAVIVGIIAEGVAYLFASYGAIAGMAGGIAATCGMIGAACAIAGLVVAVVVLIVFFATKEVDPITDFIETSGKEYGFYKD